MKIPKKIKKKASELKKFWGAKKSRIHRIGKSNRWFLLYLYKTPRYKWVVVAIEYYKGRAYTLTQSLKRR